MQPMSFAKAEAGTGAGAGMEGMARTTNSTCSNNNQTLNYCCCGMQNQCKDRRDAKIEEMAE